ncbi:cactin-like, partial [Asbolus verrucosus]
HWGIMGNIGSQTGQITQRPQSEEQQWAHSFPRTQPRLNQHKVLPERDARQKLRHTNNGEILQSGGTLSGRHHQNRLSLRERDSPSDEFVPNEKPSRTYLPNQRDPLHKSGSRYTQAMDYKHFQNGFNHNAYRENMKKFGSEPDLRQSKMTEAQDRSKGKKKYKAPPPPNLQTVEKSQLDWEENSSGDNGPTRRARLFKTRAETKKNYSSPVHNHKSLEKHEEIVQIRDRDRNVDLRTNRLSLPEMITPNFHQELKEVTKRLRHTRASTDNTITEINNRNNKEKLKTLDHNIHKKDNIRQRLKHMETVEEKKTNDCIREDGSGKESSSPDQSSPRLLRNKSKDQPKTFYFGMDETMQNDDYHNDIVDHFASNLHSMTHIQKIANSSESDISSEIEVDENHTGSRNGIDLQLRPILPKKQLEIPRFSPAAAWRLLSAVDSNPAASTIASDDVPVFIEDRIEKYSRPPPPTMQMGQRSNNDKSGDSGISGDAGPTGYDDSPEAIMNSRNSLLIPPSRSQGISWTPQQDLGDDSSMEEGLNNENSSYKSRQTKYINKPHVFSLSLPRDNHLSAYMSDKTAYSGLQKLKRSVSGVLGTLGNKKDFMQPNLSQDQSDNWFLSKSAPNSLNNGFNSLELKNSSKSDEKDQLLVPNSKSSGRLMYLPEFDTNQDHRHARSKVKDDLRERSKSADRSKTNHKLSVFSKSCENINGEAKSSSEPEPEDLQDPPKTFEETKNWNRKPKRFTFQSTVRQIERRRLAEKLSREAERKEKQRLRELEAMQKVEEEFQKKRAREKANIRQQLRLFSMDDVAWSSLPPNPKDEVRPEPDGAVSSSTTSSPSLPLHKTEQSKKVYQKNKKATAGNGNHKHRPSSESSEDARIKAHVTQVLSEYRHPQREYKEYTGSTRYLSDLNDTNHTKTTIHPQVTCNMPKAKQGSNKTSGTNYRKDFAHGVKSTRSAGSTYSEDSQSRNNSPRMYHNKYAPMTRF